VEGISHAEIQLMSNTTYGICCDTPSVDFDKV